MRTRVTKKGRRAPALSKHAHIALPPHAKKKAAAVARAVDDALPPCSPVSVAPLPASTTLPLPSPALAELQPARKHPQAPALFEPTATQHQPVADRLSLAFRPDGPLVGREEEMSSIRETLTRLTARDQPTGSLYLCGLPGTGKTLVVSRIVSDLAKPVPSEGMSDADADDVHRVWVNCANLSRPKELFAHIAEELRLPLPRGPTGALEAVRSFAATDGGKVVVVLDELDFLTSRDQSVLYAAFELSKLPDSRVVLVGIANALDLPTRLLPWLRAGGCLPETLSFAPYSSSALAAIVRQRLADSGALSTSAVLLAAKKVASASGDARLVLDVVREAASQTTGDDGALAGVAAVSRLAATRGGTSAAAKTVRDLPVVQQLALCAAANAAAATNGKKRATLGGLHAGFTRLCSRARVAPLAFADFADVCTNALAHHGLLDVPATGPRRGARTQRGRQVRLRVAIEDVKAGVADKGFLPFLVQEGL